MRSAAALAVLALSLSAEAHTGRMTASWYGVRHHGRLTASGERFDRNALTAAHRTLPLGTLLRVVNPATGAAVLVRINDRGPYIRGRDLDLSQAAARRLGFERRGVALVDTAVVR